MINKKHNDSLFEKKTNLTRRCSSKYLQKMYNKISKLEESGNPKYFEIMQIFIEDSEIYNKIFHQLESLQISIKNILKRNFDSQRFKYISEIMHRELVNAMYKEISEIKNLFKNFDFEIMKNYGQKKSREKNKNKFKKNKNVFEERNNIINESFNCSLSSKTSLSNNNLGSKNKKKNFMKKDNEFKKVFFTQDNDYKKMFFTQENNNNFDNDSELSIKNSLNKNYDNNDFFEKKQIGGSIKLHKNRQNWSNRNNYTKKEEIHFFSNKFDNKNNFDILEKVIKLDKQKKNINFEEKKSNFSNEKNQNYLTEKKKIILKKKTKIIL